MDFRIINNLSNDSTHWARLTDLFSLSDEAIITSPYLMTDFADFLGETDLSKIKKIHLVTTLAPNSFEQIKKITSLASLINFPEIKDKKIGCQISINNKLHGKIYIFKNNGDNFCAIISSANFTDSGLSRNHEWGIEISDKETIKDLEQSIIENIQIPALSADDIYTMQQASNDFLEREPQSEERKIDLNLLNLLPHSNWASKLDDTIDYWLKPIGVTGSPVEEGREFNTLIEDLHFSKQRPNGVKPNDILICYGVGTGRVLSIYKVISFPDIISEEEMHEEEWYERWPWYVTGENLTPNFGSNWWIHNFYISRLLDEYLTINEEGEITSVGGTTLGGLNFGKDKLKLSINFARFIIERVVQANNETDN